MSSLLQPGAALSPALPSLTAALLLQATHAHLGLPCAEAHTRREEGAGCQAEEGTPRAVPSEQPRQGPQVGCSGGQLGSRAGQGSVH